MNKKLLTNLTLLISTSIIHMLVLTGCSTVSQYCPPILTNNTTNNSPFQHGFDNSNDNLNDPYLSYARDKNNNSLDKNLANIKEYLPNKYLYTSAYDNSFKLGVDKFYSYNGYSSFDIDWSNHHEDKPYQIDTNTYYDKKWIATDDENAKFLDKLGKINSYQNLINYIASTSINSISFNFLTMINYMNNFINKIIGQNDTNKINELLNNVFTHSYSSFNHGAKNGEQNYDFFQFCYNNANLISTGNSQYKFGPYSIEWNQEYSGIDIGLTNDINNNTPFIKLEVQDLREDPIHPFDTTNEKNKSLSYLIPTNTAFTGTYTYDTVNKKYEWHKVETMSPYCIYSYDENDKKHEQDPKDIIGIASVPTLIHLSNVYSNYYNPTVKTNSISINDWLIQKNDINKINNEIDKNKAWRNMSKHVDNYEPKINSVSFKQEFTNIERNIDKNNIDYKKWTNNDFDLDKIDPTIKYWCDDNNKFIQPGDFITLAQYNLMDISFKYYDVNGNEVNYRSKLPYFSGFSGLVPAYFAFNSNYYSPIDNIKENDQHKIFNFGQDSKMYEDWSNIIKTLTKTKVPEIDSTQLNTSFDAFTKDPYMIFRWMFGGYDYENNNIVFNKSQPIDSRNIYFNLK